MEHIHLTPIELINLADSIYTSILGVELFQRWKTLKEVNNFHSEKEFVTWMLDFVEVNLAYMSSAPHGLGSESTDDHGSADAATGTEEGSYNQDTVVNLEANSINTDNNTTRADIYQGHDHQPVSLPSLPSSEGVLARRQLTPVSTGVAQTHGAPPDLSDILITTESRSGSGSAVGDEVECLDEVNTSYSGGTSDGRRSVGNDTFTAVSFRNTSPPASSSMPFTSSADIPLHMLVDKTRVFPCNLCREQFSTKTALCAHRNATHSDARGGAHMCTVCSETFPSRTQRIKHELSKHRHDVRVYPCDACGKLFPSSSNLSHHRSNVHLKKNACRCHCGKAFSTRGNLREHVQRVHAGPGGHAATHACFTCGETFTTEVQLMIHCDSQHNPRVSERIPSSTDQPALDTHTPDTT